MKERPILFSAPMVRALLNGTKTQTRRMVKPQPDYVNSLGIPFWPDGKGPVDYRLCPYGQAGDRLWVRETWAPDADIPNGTIYRADPGGDYQDTSDGFKWHPSIHMHRWRSRITLEIADVRVERLQDINGQDSIAEGIKRHITGLEGCTISTFQDYLTGATDRAARQSYQTLWESINGPGSWETNPWVWVITFKPVSI
jgi:hypothetical protein